MNTLVTTLYFLAGSFLVYEFFSTLGCPSLFLILRGRPPIESGGLRYLTGVVSFATLVYLFEKLGCKIVYSALFAIAVSILPLALGPWRRLKWQQLASDDLTFGALWPPLIFVALTALLFSKPGMQVFYEMWMYFSIERNIAFDLFPAINPGLMGETVEKSRGGFMLVGGLAGLLHLDAKDVSICCKLANLFAFFSLSRAFLARFGASRFLANTLGSLMLMVTAMTPLFLWIFLHVSRPALLKKAWGAQDVFRDIIGPHSSANASANAAFYTEVFHLFDNVLGVLFVCAAVFVATFYQARRRAIGLFTVLFWGACLIYSMYALEIGIIIAAVALMTFVFSRSSLRRRFASSGLYWVYAAGVAMAGLLLASKVQSFETAHATVAVLGGTYLGLTLLPHLSNLLAPLGVLTLVILLTLPLYHWEIGKRATRMYWAVWLAVILIILFLRTVGGNNYKFAFVIPFLALPMLTTLTKSLGVMWNSRRLTPYLVVGSTYGSLALLVSLFYFSQFANKTAYPMWSDASERGRYISSIYPTFQWIREHTARNAYVLIYPYALPSPTSTTVSNFIPAFGMQRRVVYIRDPMYTDPLPAANYVLPLIEEAYGIDPKAALTAVEELSKQGRIYAISTPDHPLGCETALGQPVFQAEGLKVYLAPGK